MCHAVKCRQCGKTSWSGCGAHVAQVKARVPADQWCDGHRGEGTGGSGGFLGRLFGTRGGAR